jgi:hypothetical protein
MTSQQNPTAMSPTPAVKAAYERLLLAILDRPVRLV